jgi:hypothetical protein
MLRNEKKPPCKCGSASRIKKPVPRFPTKKETIVKECLVQKNKDNNDMEKKRVNRYRWILTRMRDGVEPKSKSQVIGGFLPFTPLHRK